MDEDKLRELAEKILDPKIYSTDAIGGELERFYYRILDVLSQVHDAAYKEGFNAGLLARDSWDSKEKDWP